MRGKRIWGGIFILLAGAAAGALLLTLAYMLPVNPENKINSLETIESEGWYPRASVSAASYDTYFHSFYPDVLDGLSDRVMLYTAMDASEGNPFLRAMDSYSEYVGHYSYYWHGYVAVLRPLLLLFDYAELRGLNGICQSFLVLLLAFVIGKEKGLRYVLALGTSWLLLKPLALSMSLQFSWVFYIACLGTLVLLFKREYFSVFSRFVYIFMIVGMLTSYFDLLTYPLLTWGMPLAWWLVMKKHPGHAGAQGSKAEALAYVGEVIVSGIAWIAGYAGMWVMKWAIASPVLGQNIFRLAAKEIFLRVGASKADAIGLAERLGIIDANWKHYGYMPYVALLACWLLWWFCDTWKNGGCKGSKRYAYFLLGFSCIVWYFVLANHVQVHHFFTYRILSVGILAFLALVLDTGPSAADKRPMQEGVGGKPWAWRKKVCCIWALAVLIAVSLTLLVREDVFVTNGDVAFDTMQISQNVVAETEFTPGFHRILTLGIGLECPGTQGEWEVILWEGEKVKDRQIIPIRNVGEASANGHYQVMTVNWKLKPGKTYRFTVEVKDNDAPASLWVTKDGKMPLEEYRNLTVGGEAVEGQLLSGVLYRCLPVSKKVLLFYFLTWTGILAAVMFTLGQGLLQPGAMRRGGTAI